MVLTDLAILWSRLCECVRGAVRYTCSVRAARNRTIQMLCIGGGLKMATVSHKNIVDEIIAGDGWYPGDHTRVVRIVEYNNQWNGRPCLGPDLRWGRRQPLP